MGFVVLLMVFSTLASFSARSEKMHGGNSESEAVVLKPDVNAFSYDKKRSLYVKYDSENFAYLIRECDLTKSPPKKIEDCDEKTEIKLGAVAFENSMKQNFYRLAPALFEGISREDFMVLRDGSANINSLRDVSVSLQEKLATEKTRLNSTRNSRALKDIKTNIETLETQLEAAKKTFKDAWAKDSARYEVFKRMTAAQRANWLDYEKKADSIVEKIKAKNTVHSVEHISYESELDRSKNALSSTSEKNINNGIMGALEESFDRPPVPCFSKYDFATRVAQTVNDEPACADLKNSTRGKNKNWKLFKVSLIGEQFWQDNNSKLVWQDPSVDNMGYQAATKKCTPPFRLPTESEMKAASESGLFEAFPVLNSRWALWVQNEDWDRASAAGDTAKIKSIKRFQIQKNKYDERGNPVFVKKILSEDPAKVAADVMCVVDPQRK